MAKDVNNIGDIVDADYSLRDIRMTQMTRVSNFNGQPNLSAKQHYVVGKKGSQTPTSDGKSHSKI